MRNQSYWEKYKFVYIAWATMHVLLFFTFGINDQEEAIKYIEMSHALWNRQYYLKLSDLFYAGYVLIHLTLQACQVSAEMIYMVQLFTSWLAIHCFILLLEQFKQSRRSINVSGILYSTCFMLQYWTTFLFTDGLFSNLLMVGIYLLYREHCKNNFTLYFFLILIPFFRPVGFLFILVIVFYWALSNFKSFIKPITFFSIYLAGLLGLVYLSFQNNPTYFYPRHNIEMNIICGYENSFHPFIKVPYHGTSIMQYFIENPEASCRLFLKRLYKTFDPTRPYFSLKNNLVRASTTLIYYALFIIGIFSLWSHARKFAVLSILGIVLFTLPSILFCVEWSGRFSIPIFIFMFCTIPWGVEKILQTKQNDDDTSP